MRRSRRAEKTSASRRAVSISSNILNRVCSRELPSGSWRADSSGLKRPARCHAQSQFQAILFAQMYVRWSQPVVTSVRTAQTKKDRRVGTRGLHFKQSCARRYVCWSQPVVAGVQIAQTSRDQRVATRNCHFKQSRARRFVRWSQSRVPGVPIAST